jgi:tetratricopeptide (TPR) repeat protein
MPIDLVFKSRCFTYVLVLICFQDNLLTFASARRMESKECEAANELVSKAIDVGIAGDIQAAWSHLRSAVHICPNNAAALGNLGYLHAIHGDNERAADFLKKSISAGPSTMEPWVNLGNIFKEELDRMNDSDGTEHKGMMTMVWKMYRTAYRLLPSVDVTANLAGLYAMERDWERAALFAEKSLSQQYTEEAFCVIMKALDNICHWEHPMRDMPRLISILERNVCQNLCVARSPDPYQPRLTFREAHAAIRTAQHRHVPTVTIAVLPCSSIPPTLPTQLPRLHTGPNTASGSMGRPARGPQ